MRACSHRFPRVCGDEPFAAAYNFETVIAFPAPAGMSRIQRRRQQVPGSRFPRTCGDEPDAQVAREFMAAAFPTPAGIYLPGFPRFGPGPSAPSHLEMRTTELSRATSSPPIGRRGV